MEKDLKKHVIDKAVEETKNDDTAWKDSINNPLGVKTEVGYKLNHRERKARIKYFTKELKINAKAGSLLLKEASDANVDESEAKVQNRQARLRQWYTRKAILERKIQELKNPDHLYGGAE
tara:strand:- start:520 stop:879 length:360 start_codon:yes stop_codon:yes gene_type:complete